MSWTLLKKSAIICVMTLQKSIETCFKKYFVFDGRAKRSEFWWFALFCFLVSMVTVIVDVVVFGYTWEQYGPMNTIFQLGVFIPSVAVGARRLHDINKTGWWQLIYLTIIGIILLIVWFASEGKNKKNKFGK